MMCVRLRICHSSSLRSGGRFGDMPPHASMRYARMSWTGPSSPPRIRLISSCRFTEWRHINPAAIFRFFFFASSPALTTRRTPTGSTANDFSMNTFTPLATA